MGMILVDRFYSKTDFPICGCYVCDSSLVSFAKREMKGNSRYHATYAAGLSLTKHTAHIICVRAGKALCINIRIVYKQTCRSSSRIAHV